MENVPEQDGHRGERENNSDHYVQFIAPMSEILMALAASHRDAYELFGGDDAYWHLEETPLKQTELEAGELRRGVELLREYAGIAAETEGHNRHTRLELKAAEFRKAMYGI
jgi:hypothetical protein